MTGLLCVPWLLVRAVGPSQIIDAFIQHFVLTMQPTKNWLSTELCKLSTYIILWYSWVGPANVLLFLPGCFPVLSFCTAGAWNLECCGHR